MATIDCPKHGYFDSREIQIDECPVCLKSRVERFEYLIACNIDPMECTDENAALVRECHRMVFPENYRDEIP